MKKNFTLAAFAAIATLFTTACSNDDTIPSTTDEAVTITTQLATATVDAAPATRATQPYAPEGGKLTLLYGTLTATGNQRAEFTCTAANWAANPTLMWEALTPAADGKYPFFAAAPAAPAAASSVSADQSTTAEYTKSDQLMAYTVAQRKEAVALTFKHVLSQLTVTLTSVATTDPEYLDLSAATITIGGGKTGYTVNSTAPTTALPATATATGNAGTGLKPLTSGTGADRKHYLVLPPQTLAAGQLTITTTVDGRPYSWTNAEALTLAAATNHAIDLTVKKSSMTLGGIQITDWDNSPAPVNGTLTEPDIILPGTTTNALPEAGTLTLAAFNADAKQGSNATYPVSYDAAKLEGERAAINTADAAYAPMKWENLPKYAAAGSTTLQPYTYAALFVPTAAPAAANHELRYLCGTSAATPWGTAPGFTGADHSLKQLMSRLVVKLAFSADFTEAEKATARLTTTRKKKVTAVTLDNTTAATVTTADASTAEAGVTLVASATDASAFSAILCPQPLAAVGDKYITLTLNAGTPTQHSYTLTADAALALAAGQQHTLTLMVKKSALTLGNIAITPWTETTGSGNVDWE